MQSSSILNIQISKQEMVDAFKKWRHDIASITGRAEELRMWYQSKAARKAAYIVAYDRKLSELEKL